MTLNTIFSNFSPNLIAKMQKDGLVKIKLSLSDDEDFGDQMKIAHKIDDFVSIHRDDILFTNLEGSVFCSDMQMSPNLIEWKRNFSENYLVKYLDMASRYYEDFYFEDNYFRGMAAKVQHNLKRPYHYHLKNAFHILANYFYNFIKENDIKLFIQHITPHEPNIWLLHCICKDLGVKTMFLHGVIINKKSYYCPMEDVSDIGVYKTAAVVNENKLDLEIENNHKIDLLDREMDLRNNSLMVKKKIKGVPFIQKDRYLFLKRRIKSYLKRELNPMQRLFYLVSQKIPDSIQADYNYINIKTKLEYYQSLESIVVDNFDLNQKFIYFPLHWQPEMTTMPLGSEYQDQLLALEHLSSILPKGWKIVAKEHLTQTGAMRDNLWFDRFKSIGNVVMVGYETDTYSLIGKSQIVATVTGTAGFEAVIGGKPAIIFGAAWYAGCDGIFRYNDSLDLKEISSYEVNHSKIQAFIDHLSMRLSNLQIDLSYVEEDIDASFHVCNEEKILRTLSLAIGGGGQYLDDPEFLQKLTDVKAKIAQSSIRNFNRGHGGVLLKFQCSLLRILCVIVPTKKARNAIRNKGPVVINKFLGRILSSFVPTRKGRKKVRGYFV